MSYRASSTAALTLNDTLIHAARTHNVIIRLEPGCAVLVQHAFTHFSPEELESRAVLKWTQDATGAVDHPFHAVVGYITILGEKFDLLWEPEPKR